MTKDYSCILACHSFQFSVFIELITQLFLIWHFTGNDECGGSNQVAVALVIIPFIKERKWWEARVVC